MSVSFALVRFPEINISLIYFEIKKIRTLSKTLLITSTMFFIFLSLNIFIWYLFQELDKVQNSRTFQKPTEPYMVFYANL